MQWTRRILIGTVIVLSLFLLPAVVVHAQSPAAPAADLEVLTLGNGGSCTAVPSMDSSSTAVPEPSWLISTMPTGGCGQCVTKANCQHRLNCVVNCVSTCCEYTCQ
jgi:hypothetical protein